MFSAGARPPHGLRARKKLHTWREIRSAAQRLLAEHNYAEVSIDMIAAEANVSRATFFNYFGSKEAVVFDADPEELAAYQALLDARPADEPVWASLREILIMTVDSVGEQMVVQRHLLQRNRALADSGRSFGDQFRQALTAWATERAIASGATELRAALVVAAADAAATTAYRFWDPLSGAQTLRDLIAEAFDTVGAPIAPPGAA